jgi:hypothetical protein
MAINVIGRIQVRSGLNDDLPQLAKGEFGWSVDTQQLYIGNGTVADGAPQTGNTELLTATGLNDALANTNYTLLDIGGAVVPITGPGGSSTFLSLQSVLDDGFISVKKFGAVGDGVTNDLDAINNALYQLYCLAVATVPQVKRVLYFPAGVYKITGGVLKIPPFCTIIGDGVDSTIIKQFDSTQEYIAKFSDSLQQVDNLYGTVLNNVTPGLSQFVTISDLTFYHTASRSIVYAIASNNVSFSRVKFRGALSNPTVVGTGCSAVVLSNNTTNTVSSYNWLFDNCIFTKLPYAFLSNSDTKSVNFQNCTFSELYKGIVLGLSLDANNTIGPYYYKFTYNDFDKISSYAIQLETGKNAISQGNTFRDVGNTQTGISNPAVENIRFNGTNCISSNDIFDRTAAQAILVAWVYYKPGAAGSNSLLTFSANGSTVTSSGIVRTLNNNTIAVTALDIEIPIITKSFEMSYSITRTISSVVQTRNGTLRSTAGVSEDDYTETATLGITFSVALSNASNSWVVKYTTTNLSPAADATLSAQCRYFLS